MNLDFLSKDVENIFAYLTDLLQDGGKKSLNLDGEIKPTRNIFGYSGFDYVLGDVRAQVSMGLILGGTGFVLRRISRIGSEESERHDYFNIQGELSFSSDKEALKALMVDTYEMDLTCPILDHLYNFLSYEYKQANEGKSRTELVHSVERYLKTLYLSKSITLPIKLKTNDPAIINIYNKMLNAEMDPVLTWEERQVVFNNYRQTMDQIVQTKVRAHRLNKTKFKMGLISKNLGNFTTRFISRPASNANGILYKYTIGKILWFFRTVKNNLGYSIALAVYGPFTYYFITMPMNPHAMQAVGRVRSTYLEVKNDLGSFLNKGEVVINDMASKEAVAAAPKPIPLQDSVKTTQSSVSTAPDTSHIIFSSQIIQKNKDSLVLQMGDGKTELASAALMNMLVSTDVDKINHQSWFERMSNFKQMQIAYEENIEYASRMGRLEQLETQYNFPMQVESTWEELERYNNYIFKLRQENPNISAKMKQYLANEVDRTQQLELYLWDRMGRFILDQIYVMLDQDKEQKRNDYYVGRSFVFMQEMTNILSWRYKDFKKPEGYERIAKLADFYAKSRKEYGSVMKNLEANSDLFKQKNIYDTKEFRSYMKRQWEILFLQNAKAEEASNMGLNMYIWSVRNTVWEIGRAHV